MVPPVVREREGAPKRSPKRSAGAPGSQVGLRLLYICPKGTGFLPPTLLEDKTRGILGLDKISPFPYIVGVEGALLV